MMRKIDAHIRRRLRAIILRHWKRKRTIAKRLVALGVNPGGRCGIRSIRAAGPGGR